MSMSLPEHDPRRSRWIPWVFVGGMLLVLLVNVGMVVSALTTFTGVTTGRAYDKGRAYNHVLEEAARQDALGWRATVVVEARTLRLAVQDRAGLAVPGRAAGVLHRPMDGLELPLALVAEAAGWTAALPAAPAGLWEARLTLTDAEGHRLDIRQRVVLR
jgi:nitrogen fixation protein FixH